MMIAFERVAQNPSRHRTHPIPHQGNGMNVTLTYEAHLVEAVYVGGRRGIGE